MDTGTKILWIRIDSQSKRRWMVVALYIGYVVTYALAADARISSGFRFLCDFAGSAVAGLILGGCWLALVKLTREYGFPGDSRLETSRDERQNYVRYQAFVRAYRAITILLCGAGIYYVVAQQADFWLPHPPYSKPLLFGLILLILTLPSAFTAWVEPDEIA
ncbi:MAG TPA: hypothetical protein VKX25_04100 [Bryobacteraceae bacterium]|jgi:hypothetical protein|nr:hypothetical protein [Bryobacteraceae bacterium]